MNKMPSAFLVYSCGPVQADSFGFMRKLFITLLVASFLVCSAACRLSKKPADGAGITINGADGKPVIISDNSRLVSINTSVTETVYALGAQDKIVAVDRASTEYIPESASKPNVGSFRTLSPEGILALKPTLLITTADTGPPEAVQQLRDAGIAVLTLPVEYTVESVKGRIRTIARALGLEAKGEEVVAQMERDLADADALVKKAKDKPRTMFCGRPAAGAATMMGRNTTVDTMMKLAGAVNVVDGFDGSRPATDEALVAAQPDVIVMTTNGFKRGGGMEGALQVPGILLTPAGKNRRIITVSDMYFMGFGPGMGRAVKEFALQLHPDLAPAGSKQ